MEPPETPHLPAHVLFIRSRILPVLKSKDPYLSSEYMEEHCIESRRMDLYTGRPLSLENGEPDESSELFTQLYSWDAMDRAIEENKPWKDSSDDDEHHLEWDPDLHAWWKAVMTGRVLNRYLSGHHMEALEDVCGVLDDTNWEPRL